MHYWLDLLSVSESISRQIHVCLAQVQSLQAPVTLVRWKKVVKVKPWLGMLDMDCEADWLRRDTPYIVCLCTLVLHFEIWWEKVSLQICIQVRTQILSLIYVKYAHSTRTHLHPHHTKHIKAGWMGDKSSFFLCFFHLKDIFALKKSTIYTVAHRQKRFFLHATCLYLIAWFSLTIQVIVKGAWTQACIVAIDGGVGRDIGVDKVVFSRNADLDCFVFNKYADEDRQSAHHHNLYTHMDYTHANESSSAYAHIKYTCTHAQR